MQHYICCSRFTISLPQESTIFLVDTNGILDDFRIPGMSDECARHVVDDTLAVTAQRELVGQNTKPVFSDY
jgi:hypothetical protein